MAGKPQPRIEHPDNQLNLEYKFIALTRGQYAKVDAELFDHLSQWNWHAQTRRDGFHAKRWAAGGGLLFLHREVWEYLNGSIPEGYTIDHENRDPLDDRIQNLRLATTTEQNRNQRRQQRNTSGFIGVSRFREKWKSYVSMDGRSSFVGSFDDPVDAAKARDLVAWIEYGEFASLNFLGLYGAQL
jgi:hypothetical protein